MQQTSCNKESEEKKNVHIQYMIKDKNLIKNSNKIEKSEKKIFSQIE